MKTFMNYLNESINPNEMTEEEQIQFVQEKVYNIKFIYNPSERIQLAAVTKNKNAFKYMDNPCKSVILAIDFDNKTEEEKIKYVQSYWENIKNIRNPSLRVQLAAVKADPFSIEFIINAYEQVQLLAIEKDTDTMSVISRPTEKVKLTAVKKNGSCIQWINNPSEEIKLEAVKNDPEVIRFINNPNEEMKKIAANNIDLYKVLKDFATDSINDIQKAIKDYITKEIYYKAPKDFPWIPEIKNKFKDIDRFKRFNL